MQRVKEQARPRFGDGGRAIDGLAASDHYDSIIFRNGRGAVVGRLSENGWLEKSGLVYEAHHLHRFGAWATEARHIEELRAVGGKGVRLYLNDGRVLESRLELWERHAFAIHFAGSQLALSDKWWEEVGRGRHVPLPFEVPF